MNTTVLVLGDESDWESYNLFCKQLQKQHHSKKLKWVTATYALLEKDGLPLIESDMLIIYLFFPFTYWDKYIEKEGYEGVYGNVDFYNKFRVFWSEIHRILRKVYRGKKIRFINHPLKIAVDWKNTRKMPDKIASQIHTVVMHGCVPAVGIAKDLGLPPPIPLPQVRLDAKSKKAEFGPEVA